MPKSERKTQQTDTISADKADVGRKKLGRRTAEESKETRQALLQAAAASFAERGLNGAKLDDIAQRAGVTKGAIYSHFDDREDLLLKACRQAIRSLQIFEFASKAPDLLTFFNETSQVLLAPENKDARMLNIEVHLSATRSEHMADLLAEWQAEVLETLRTRASQAGGSPEATMVIIHILLLGLSHIDAFEAIGADRDEVMEVLNRVTGALFSAGEK